MLSDPLWEDKQVTPVECLNAPFGAQCFPTDGRRRHTGSTEPVSMHLLVLSAFRLEELHDRFGGDLVSMHLLVLSAFRHDTAPPGAVLVASLNAPFGAQCFPTLRRRRGWGGSRVGSQCTFWCSVLSDIAQ